MPPLPTRPLLQFKRLNSTQCKTSHFFLIYFRIGPVVDDVLLAAASFSLPFLRLMLVMVLLLLSLLLVLLTVLTATAVNRTSSKKSQTTPPNNEPRKQQLNEQIFLLLLSLIFSSLQMKAWLSSAERDPPAAFWCFSPVPAAAYCTLATPQITHMHDD